MLLISDQDAVSGSPAFRANFLLEIISLTTLISDQDAVSGSPAFRADFLLEISELTTLISDQDAVSSSPASFADFLLEDSIFLIYIKYKFYLISIFKYNNGLKIDI